MADVIIRPTEVRVQRDGDRVVIVGLPAVTSMSWQKATEFARAILAQARRAEEEAKAEDIAIDQAFLARAGVPLRLTERADIMDAARIEAQHNTALRKQLPGGVRAEPTIGVPGVVKHKRG